MSNISRRRRLAGRALLGAGVLALPLTATISYAAQDVPVDDGSGEQPMVAEAVPADTVADPAAPAEPAAIGEETVRVIRIAPEDGERTEVERVFRIERRGASADGESTQERVFRLRDRGLSAEDRAEIEASMAELREIFAENGEISVKLRESLGEHGELGKELRLVQRRFAEDGEHRRALEEALSSASKNMPRMIFRCDGSGETVRETLDEDGSKTMIFCQSAALGTARAAIGHARRAVERDRNLSDKERREALESLDDALREIDQG